MLNGVALVTALSGPLVLVAFGVGILTEVETSKRLSSRDARALVAAAITVAVTLFVWWVVRALAPGSSQFAQSSAVGFLSSQVLRVWESLALWTGAAVAVGTMLRPHRGREGPALGLGGSGLAPAIATVALYLPLVITPAVLTWVLTRPLVSSSAQAWAITIAGAISASWVFSVVDPRAPWGLVYGPETALWSLVVGGAVLARVVAGSARAEAAQ